VLDGLAEVFYLSVGVVKAGAIDPAAMFRNVVQGVEGYSLCPWRIIPAAKIGI
jgi:hypothetical protein